MSRDTLGTFLRDHRAKLDATALGFSSRYRMTTGLRREEVAEAAGVSVIWYTNLEQGRTRARSADVVERIARVLMLTESEREHLFLLAFGRAQSEVRGLAARSSPP
jgi:transcriptional regulator with XRE-family HTH domain